MVLKIKQRGKRFINLMEQYFFSVFQQCLQQIQLRSPSFYRIFLILFYVVFVIATFSKSDVTGEKTFWIHGIQGLGMGILFGWFGTILIFSTLEKEDYSSYMAILLIVYIISAIAYTCLVMFLIKKDIYNSDSNKKVMGGWSFVCFGMLGISVC